MIEKTAAMLELEQQRKAKIEQEERAREALEQAEQAAKRERHNVNEI